MKKSSAGFIGHALLIIIGLIILLVLGYLFLARPYKVSGENIVFPPYEMGKLSFSEKITYLFRKPVVGDRVIFSPLDPYSTYIGIITKEDTQNGVTVYTLSSTGKGQPWTVSIDKISGKIYYPALNQDEAIKIVSALNSAQSPSPTPTPTSVQNQTSCEVSDSSFCSTLTKIQSLIADKDFINLASYIDLTNLTCIKDSMGYSMELCNNVADGGVVQGYVIGYNLSEGAIVSKNNLVTTLNNTFASKNYIYRGSLTQNDKGEIVYLTGDKKELFVLSLKKINSNWRIKMVLLGFASNDFINLDPASLSNIN